MIDRRQTALELFKAYIQGRIATGRAPDRFTLKLDSVHALAAAEAFETTLADASTPAWAGAASLLDACYEDALRKLLDEANAKLGPNDSLDFHRIIGAITKTGEPKVYAQTMTRRQTEASGAESYEDPGPETEQQA